MKLNPVLFFVTVLTATGQLLAQTTVLTDDFNDGVVDTEKWDIILPLGGSAISEANGVLTTAERGTLFTKKEMPVNLEVTGSFQMNHASEHFKVVLRSDGSIVDSNTVAERKGISFAFLNDGDQIQIQRQGPDEIEILAVKSYSLTNGQSYSFRIVANGASLSLSVNGTEELTTSNSYAPGNLVGIYSRELAGRSSDVDSLSIKNLAYKGGIFQIIEGDFTWQEAKADAESRGGRLAVLNTQDKIDEVNSYLNGLGTWPYLYIGLTDEEVEGEWKWITGQPLTVSNWYPGEPTNGTNESYGEYFASSRNLGAKWNNTFNSITEATSYLLELPLTDTQLIRVAAGSLPESSWDGVQSVEEFHMGKTEVTWAQFQEVRTWAAANGYDIGSAGAGTDPNHPVTGVNWYEVVKWCNASSEKEGLTPVYNAGGLVYRGGNLIPTVDATANGYRLPSEKEWEFAARGGILTNGYEHSGSDDSDAVAWYNGNSGGSPQEVATKQANELGIYDMSGNAWEWCFDKGSNANRIGRGGSWGAAISPLSRGSRAPANRSIYVGFRVARSFVETTDRNKTFQIIEGDFTWQEAKADAELRGGRLAVLNTQEMINAANNYLQSIAPWPYLYIGLTDEEVEGEWKWINGEPLSVSNWYPGEPSNNPDASYGEYFASSRNLGTVWNNTLNSWPDAPSSYLLELFTDIEFIKVVAGSLPESSWDGAQSVEAFYMGKTEVTWEKFQEVRTWATENGYDIGEVGAGLGPNRPVTSVNWYEAVKWCNAWSEKEGLAPVYKIGGSVYRSGDSVPTVDTTANGYRLPSEKEWEFAARGGVASNGFQYSGSNDIDEVAWYGSNSFGAPQDVATKQANELGIYDMTGNVAEWCFDASIFASLRMTRDGSYNDLNPAINHNVEKRGEIQPQKSGNGLGFRVARSALDDTDGDGVPDASDAFPLDSAESVDTDGDGTGNKADTDADNDGVTDTADAFPLDSSKYSQEPVLIQVVAGSLPESYWDGAQDVDAVYMANTEVTWIQFHEVRTWAVANGYDIGSVGQGINPNYPVTSVNWYQVQKWCNAWSEKEGLDPVYTVDGLVYRAGEVVPTANAASNGYRLPSDKEWEFAARGGVLSNDYTYSGSDDLDAVGWYRENSGDSTQVVATKQANELGIYDMSGNVWEWCFDSDGEGRFLRGGSFGTGPRQTRIVGDTTNPNNPTTRNKTIGFRVARSALYDTDRDGEPDASDAFPLDSTESVDTDGDGTGDNADTDDDGDGMPDEWETRYSLLKNEDDRTSDHDGDGVPAWMEYIAGTSPNDETSRLDVTVDMVDGKPHVSLDTVSGRSYEFLVTQDFQTYVVWHTQSGTGNSEELVFDMDSPEVEAEFGANPGKTFFFQVRIQLSD